MIATDDPRLKAQVRAILEDPTSRLFVCAVILWEFADLNWRGRFGLRLPIEALIAELDIEMLDTPIAASWFAETLPDIHRDPIDRMLIAHALHAGLPIVTADATIRRYPARTIW